MKLVFDQLNKKVHSAIIKAPDCDLISDDFESEILTKFELQFPELDKANEEIRIDEEIVGFHNVPDGGSFIFGQKMPYIEINVPVKGCCLLFKVLSHDFYKDNKLDFCYGILSYREFRRIPIEGDDAYITSVQQKVWQLYDNISDTLGKFKPEAEALFSGFITQMRKAISDEKEKRGLQNQLTETKRSLA